MRQAGLWRIRKQKVVAIHVWRERRERVGELVPWDTSTHDWLKGRSEKIYRIKMIDDQRRSAPRKKWPVRIYTLGGRPGHPSLMQYPGSGLSGG